MGLGLMKHNQVQLSKKHVTVYEYILLPNSFPEFYCPLDFTENEKTAWISGK